MESSSEENQVFSQKDSSEESSQEMDVANLDYEYIVNFPLS